RCADRGPACPAGDHAGARHDGVFKPARLGIEGRRRMATDPRKERRAGARDANTPHAKRQSTAAATVEQAHRLVARITEALGATAEPPSRMRRMRVAVVDVGANTLRLLVAETDARGGF